MIASLKYHNLLGAMVADMRDNHGMASTDKNDGPIFLKAWREARNLTQSELAEAADTSQNMIGYLESGERAMTVKWMRRLGPALDIPPGWLVDHHPNEREQAEPPAEPRNISAERLAPILALCLRHAPKGGWAASEAPRLARAVEYALELLATAPANQTSEDAIAVAGQAALLQLRDQRPGA